MTTECEACDNCGNPPTHVLYIDVSEAVRGVHRDIRDKVFYCTTCAEEHFWSEPLPTRADILGDQGLDDWSE